MAKVLKRRERRRDDTMPLGRDNFKIIGVGALVIGAGYLAMIGQPVEGFLPLVVSPILLVLGYCVIIPLGILYKKSYLAPKDTSQT